MLLVSSSIADNYVPLVSMDITVEELSADIYAQLDSMDITVVELFSALLCAARQYGHHTSSATGGHLCIAGHHPSRDTSR